MFIIDKILKEGELVIGEFEVELNINEEMISGNVKLGNMSKLKISVYPEITFTKPHLHISGTINTLPDGDAIVYLDRGEMWPHDTNQSLLDQKASKAFDSFMRSPYRKNKRISNWQACVNFWNEYHQIKVNIISQPDYTQLYKNIDYTNYKKK